MNQYLNDKYLRNILELLGYLLEAEEQQIKKNLILHELSGITKWERIGYIGFLVFLLAFTAILSFLARNYNDLSKQTINFWGNILLILLTFSFLSLMTSVVSLGIKIWKTSRESTSKYIKRIGEDALFARSASIKITKIIGTNNQSLEYIKINFKYLIDEIESREKIMESFAPVLSIIVVVAYTNILGISIDKLNLPYISGGGAVIVLITQLIQFMSKLMTRTQIIKLKRSLSILEQAQITAPKFQ